MLTMYPDLHAAEITGTVYGAVLNFRADLAALGAQLDQPPYKAPPRAPVLYIKPANTWLADSGAIPLPAEEPAIQVAATIGLVIGVAAARVSEAHALTHISALRLVNDVTLPHDSVFRPAIRQRCRDGFCPIGPPIPLRDLAAFLAACRLRTFINGVLQHEWSTADLVRGPARLLADVSEFMTLLPGDVLLLGSPRAAPLARVGERVRVEASGLGELEITIVRESGVRS
jgi:5-oxopent-3-ene-1,2,5-tricarboxylate decarboxylase / 2-hydroxyhepta-2,4-diene-1,7-dioate isomerase